MYLDKIIGEFPAQFQNKKATEVFVAAISRQLDELHEVFIQLEMLRSLETATGKQLDKIGDIVVLSRAEAGLLAGNKITFPVIDDERYRHFLKYKILKNTSTCNYYDMMTAIEMIFGVNDIEYFENPEEPATVTLTFPEPEVEFDEVPPIKAAGVGLHIKLTKEIHSTARIYAGTLGTALTRITVPPVSPKDRKLSAVVRAGCTAVEYARVTVRPHSGKFERRQTARVFVCLGRAEFMRVTIPAYRRE